MRIRFSLICVLVLAGCATSNSDSIRITSTADIPQTEEKYQNRFSRTEQGMSLSAFQAVWPEAYYSLELTDFSLYEFYETTWYHTDQAKNYGCNRRAFFYFTRPDGVLAHYNFETSIVEIDG